MALINCPECGKEVSSKATVCIHCGYPLCEDIIQNDSCDNNIVPFENISTRDKGILVEIFIFVVNYLDTIKHRVDEEFRHLEVDSDYHDIAAYDYHARNTLPKDFAIIIERCNSLLSYLTEEIFGNRINVSFDAHVLYFIDKYFTPINQALENGNNEIIKNAYSQYQNEIMQNSHLSFNVYTNSIIGATLYALQSAEKEAVAQKNAERNMAQYKKVQHAYFEQNIMDMWEQNFDDTWMRDFEILQIYFLKLLEEEIFLQSGLKWTDVATWVNDSAIIEEREYFEKNRKAIKLQQEQTERNKYSGNARIIYDAIASIKKIVNNAYLQYKINSKKKYGHIPSIMNTFPQYVEDGEEDIILTDITSYDILHELLPIIEDTTETLLASDDPTSYNLFVIQLCEIMCSREFTLSLLKRHIEIAIISDTIAYDKLDNDTLNQLGILLQNVVKLNEYSFPYYHMIIRLADFNTPSVQEIIKALKEYSIVSMSAYQRMLHDADIYNGKLEYFKKEHEKGVPIKEINKNGTIMNDTIRNAWGDMCPACLEIKATDIPWKASNLFKKKLTHRYCTACNYEW